MSNSKKSIIYGIVFLVYAVVMICLPLNYFMPLILVPFVAWGWAATVLIGFIRDYKNFKEDIATDRDAQWDAEAQEYQVTWQEEPHDTEWKFETIAIVFFSAMYFIYIIVGFAMR